MWRSARALSLPCVHPCPLSLAFTLQRANLAEGQGNRDGGGSRSLGAELQPFLPSPRGPLQVLLVSYTPLAVPVLLQYAPLLGADAATH